MQPLQNHQPKHHRGRIHAAPDAHARLLLEIVDHAYRQNALKKMEDIGDLGRLGGGHIQNIKQKQCFGVQ
jgi:hypothetical protein